MSINAEKCTLEYGNQLTGSKSRRNNKRDDHCNRSDYDLLNLIQYHTVFMGDRTI